MPCSEVLLRRPPFRFVHDVVVAVIERTKFADGLFVYNTEPGMPKGDQLDARTFKDKGAAAWFVGRIVTYVEGAVGAMLGVRPAAVVAGQEPERTNAFLQALALAASEVGDDPSLGSERRARERRRRLRLAAEALTGDKRALEEAGRGGAEEEEWEEKMVYDPMTDEWLKERRLVPRGEREKAAMLGRRASSVSSAQLAMQLEAPP
jgi:hypothetical protein